MLLCAKLKIPKDTVDNMFQSIFVTPDNINKVERRLKQGTRDFEKLKLKNWLKKASWKALRSYMNIFRSNTASRVLPVMIPCRLQHIYMNKFSGDR